MSEFDRKRAPRTLARRMAALGLLTIATTALSGCIGGVPTNRTLYSEKQPVVERTSYAFEVRTAADGLPIQERIRLTGWFDAMQLGYGDKVAVETGGISPAAQQELEATVEQQGLLMAQSAPVAYGPLAPGVARIIVTRATAHVPGCPDWSASSDANPNNATSPNYGCAVNSNMAAMVADPEDLLRGQRGTGETVVMSSTKAIDSYRSQQPTGVGGLARPEGDN